MTRIVLSVLAAAAAATAAGATTGQDPLSAWLYNLRLPLPDAHGVVDGTSAISLTKATCTHAQNKITGSDRLPNDHQHQYKRRGPRLRVPVGLQDTLSERQRRTAAARFCVVKKASTNISLDASQETRPRPLSSSLQNCSAAAKVTALKVKGASPRRLARFIGALDRAQIIW